MSERAEGFWWVRVGDYSGVGEVMTRARYLREYGVRAEYAVSCWPSGPSDRVLVCRWHAAGVGHPGIEWGPYLGKEPPTDPAEWLKTGEAYEIARSMMSGKSSEVWALLDALAEAMP